MQHAYGFKSNDVYLFWEGLTCAPLARPLNINIRCRTPSSRYLKYIITKTLNHGKKVATSLFLAQLPRPVKGICFARYAPLTGRKAVLFCACFNFLALIAGGNKNAG